MKQTGLKFTAILPLLPKRGGHEPPHAHWDTFISCRCTWPVGPALLAGGLWSCHFVVCIPENRLSGIFFFLALSVSGCSEATLLKDRDVPTVSPSPGRFLPGGDVWLGGCEDLRRAVGCTLAVAREHVHAVESSRV